MPEVGRPTDYNKDIAQLICNEIACSSIGLKHILNNNELFPARSTLYRWLAENEEFQDMYARAKDAQADYMAEEIIDIADDGSNDFMTIIKGDQEYTVENKEFVNRSRLRIDARKWTAAKLRPNKYGEKIDVTSKGEKIGSEPIIQVFTSGIPMPSSEDEIDQ